MYLVAHSMGGLIVRCLLLVTAIAWLADPVMPSRGDTVIVATGTDAKWADQQAAQAGLAKAARLSMPAAQASTHSAT